MSSGRYFPCAGVEHRAYGARVDFYCRGRPATARNSIMARGSTVAGGSIMTRGSTMPRGSSQLADHHVFVYNLSLLQLYSVFFSGFATKLFSIFFVHDSCKGWRPLFFCSMTCARNQVRVPLMATLPNRQGIKTGSDICLKKGIFCDVGKPTS